MQKPVHKVRLFIMIGIFTILGGSVLCQKRHCEAEMINSDLFTENIYQEVLLQRGDHCIPVVFHIVYSDVNENFSDIEIKAQLDILNRDFNLMNENLFGIPSVFWNDIGNAQIRFCLAAEDPSGNPTTGITRVQTSIENVGSSLNPEGRKRIHYTFLGGQDAWDPSKYLNIWIGKMESVIGYATFPGEAPYVEEDGVIIDPSFIGALRPAQIDKPNHGHTLTHEIGHFLNLQHLWGANDSSCEADDGIADTPLQEGPNFDCPTHPVVSCGSADMFMNFMDFTNDACISFFTNDQVKRMLETLQTIRNGLTSGTIDCHQPVHVATEDFENNFIVTYLRDINSIIVRQLELTDELIQLECYGIDGRLQSKFKMSGDYSFLIPAAHLAQGFIIIHIMGENAHFTRKMILY